MTVNINHYVLSPHNGEDFNVHFNNTTLSQNDNAVVQAIANGFINPLPGTAPGIQHALGSTTSVYRRMSDAEVKATLAAKGLAPSVKGTNSRKYITDSFNKAKNFNNNILTPDQLRNDKIVEFRVERNNYKIIKQEAIPQLNAKRVNPTADVFNTEGIRPSSNKVNLGIHKNNIRHFNNNVKDVLVLNPKSPTVKNNFLRYLSTHKLKLGSIAFAVVFEGINIGLAVYEDGNKVGERTVTAISSAAGSIIGAAIFSIIPGIGTVLGGFIGGLIGGLIGSGIGTVLGGVFFSRTAPGDGPPPTEYIPMIYGFPDSEFKNENVYGAPATEYTPHNVYGVPDGDFDLDVFGAPKMW